MNKHIIVSWNIRTTGNYNCLAILINFCVRQRHLLYYSRALIVSNIFGQKIRNPSRVDEEDQANMAMRLNEEKRHGKQAFVTSLSCSKETSSF